MAGEARITAREATDAERRFMEEHRKGVSDLTLGARWTHTPDEHESRPGETLATRSHAVIRRWAEVRGARPATVPGTEHHGRSGVLRFIFGDDGNEGLREIGRGEWFRLFEERQLVFLYREHQPDGSLSNVFRLDSPACEAA